MTILGLVLFLVLVCVVLYLINQGVPGLITAEANRLIWLVISVVVVVVLVVWVFHVFGIGAGAINWGPKLG